MRRLLTAALLLAALCCPTFADAGASGLTAFWREGQTFLTWQEDADLEGESYLVFASAEPIGAKDVAGMKWIAKIPAGSNHFGFLRNVRSRRKGFFDDLATKKWYQAIQIEDDENAAKQLPDGTGLFVRTIKQPGRTYYAVAAEAGGKIVGAPAVLAEAVREKVETPGAVILQKLGDRHWMYAIFCDYELWNPDGVEDNWEGYVHIFQIRAPKKDSRYTAEPYPVAFRLHAYSAWKDWNIVYCFPRTHVNVRMLDYHLTWWYGYSDQLPRKMDKSKFPPVGTVVNFTERRVLQVARWLGKGPKNFPFKVDNERFLVRGGSMGGTGTHTIGLRNGDVFAAASADKGIYNWALPRKYNAWVGNVAPKWGPRDRNDTTNEGAGVYDVLNLPKFAASNPQLEMPFLTTGQGIIDFVIPFMHVTDYWIALEAGKHPYAAGWEMVGHASRLGSGTPMNHEKIRRDEVIPAFANASCNTPLVSGFRIYAKYEKITAKTLSIKAGSLSDKGSGNNVDGSFPPDMAGKSLVLGPSHMNRTIFRIRSNTATELTIEKGDLLEYAPPLTSWDMSRVKVAIKAKEGAAREPTEADIREKTAAKKKRFLICDGRANGNWNGYFAWSTKMQNFDTASTEDDIVDTAKKLAICIRLGRNRRTEYEKDTATADVTPRRCRSFKPAPGETVRWENWDCSDPAAPKRIGEGRVKADAHGLVTVEKFTIGKKGWGNRLVLIRE